MWDFAGSELSGGLITYENNTFEIKILFMQ